jgi:hypothetical protein
MVRSVIGIDLKDTIICDLPLNLVNNNSIQNTINLGGLSSYGGSGKIIKVNSNNDGLEYADDNNTTYSVVSPLTISNNVISLSTLTALGNANQILKVNSGGTALIYASETDTTYSAGTNINLSSTTINLDTTLTNLVSINTFKIGADATSEITLLINNGYLFNGDYLKINSGGKVIGQNTKDTKNNILGTANTSGIIASTNMSKEINTTTGDVTLTSTDTTYTVSLPLTLSAQNIIGLDNLTSYGNANQILKMNGTGTSLGWSDDNDTTYTAGTNMNLNGTAFNLNAVITLDRLNMTLGNPIYFKGSNDLNHYAKYVNDGIEIGGYGNNNKPCFQVVNTYPLQPVSPEPVGPPIPVFQVYRDKIITNQKLYMTSQPLYFRDDASHFIKYQSVGDCLEFGSYSNINNADAVFKFVNTFNSELLVSINKGNNTFEKTTNFNNDIQMIIEKKLNFDVDGNSWIKSTTADSFDILQINGKTGVKLSSTTYPSDVFLDKNTLEVSVNLTKFYNNITTSNCDLALEGDFVGTNCDLTIDGFMRVGQGLNMRDGTNLGKINMADGPIYWRNGYITNTGSYVTDTNHFTQYSGWPVDGVRTQGWQGCSLAYTRNGGGIALYTDEFLVKLGNGTAVTSDDRIKFNETRITDALSTINKLVVVEYDKKYNRELYETQYAVEMENIY